MKRPEAFCYTKAFFQLFGISEITESGESLINHVNAFQVATDTVERGIAMMKTSNELARDEEQKQFLLRVVEHRGNVVPRQTKEGIAPYQVECNMFC